nr:hypothetical protein [Legionella pneumophila]
MASEVATQPRVFIHRDYHSRNLMLVKNKDSCLATMISGCYARSCYL